MLAERIAGLCEAVRHCRDDSPLMDLLVANLPILLAFLHVSPALPFDVTLPYETYGAYGTYGTGCTLRTTAGCVRRCGIVKIRIVSLLESVVRQGSLVAWSVMSVMKVNEIMKVSVREMRDMVGTAGVSSVEQSIAQRREVLP